MEISEAELENFVFAIKSAKLRMPDGTFVCIPDNTEVEPRKIKDIFDKMDGPMDVFFALPRAREREPNTLPLGEKPVEGYDRRYIVRLHEMADENTGGNIQQIEIKKLRGKIFFSGEDTAGYEVIKISQVIRSGDSRNIPILSQEFFPPALELKALTPLYRLCQDVYHRLLAKSQMLISQLIEGNISFSTDLADGIQTMLKLQVIASFGTFLRQLIETPHLHPYVAYLEFCRLMGALSIFGKDTGFRNISFYDHEHLGLCFSQICKEIFQLLEEVIPSIYRRVRFEIRDNQLECELKEEWLTPDVELYLGVESDYEEEILYNKVNMIKLGAVRDVPAFTMRRLPGLRLQRLRRVPPGLPERANAYYFKIEREEKQWESILQDKKMAIFGAIDPNMTFYLYVLSKT
jgi:type VI secretion system protein ImpJ